MAWLILNSIWIMADVGILDGKFEANYLLIVILSRRFRTS